jgi:hypothetical protein
MINNAEIVRKRRWGRKRRSLGTFQESQILRMLLVAALIAVPMPAVAAYQYRIMSHGYYVAHKANDKICVVFQRKPVGNAWIIVGAPSYKFIADAAAVMRNAPECTK